MNKSTPKIKSSRKKLGPGGKLDYTNVNRNINTFKKIEAAISQEGDVNDRPGDEPEDTERFFDEEERLNQEHRDILGRGKY